MEEKAGRSKKRRAIQKDEGRSLSSKARITEPDSVCGDECRIGKKLL